MAVTSGSGFGAAEDVWPYLTGEWSVAFGLPVDALRWIPHWESCHGRE